MVTSSVPVVKSYLERTDVSFKGMQIKPPQMEGKQILKAFAWKFRAHK